MNQHELDNSNSVDRLSPETTRLYEEFVANFTRGNAGEHDDLQAPSHMRSRKMENDEYGGEVKLSYYEPGMTPDIEEALLDIYNFNTNGGRVFGHVLFTHQTDKAELEGQVFLVDNGVNPVFINMSVKNTSALKSSAESQQLFEFAAEMGFGREWTRFMYVAFDYERASEQAYPPLSIKKDLIMNEEQGRHMLRSLRKLESSEN